MGVRKFHSVEEMPSPPRRQPLDPENLRIAFGLAEVAQGFRPLLLKPGVYKYTSWDEAMAARAARTAGQQRPAGSG